MCLLHFCQGRTENAICQLSLCTHPASETWQSLCQEFHCVDRVCNLQRLSPNHNASLTQFLVT